MDVIFRLRRRPSQCGSPPLTTAGLYWLLYVYDFPLRLSSTTCFYGLPLRSASTSCLYGLPPRPASTVLLRRHRHRHRPSPVQVERLSFSLCDFICVSSFLKLFFFLFFF